MCGILGRLDYRGHIDDATRLARAVNLVAHRGPDGGACWTNRGFFLGHRRLAIIDLSETGTQPMATADGKLVVTYNGEIYNYLELRRELQALGYTFRTASDTEVLLHGYDAWGTDLPRRLVGMFAFGLVDRANGTLFLARDRFGEKPLLYSADRHGISFASELRPLAALMSDRRVDAEALGGFLCLNYVPGDRTLLQGVRRLQPGTWRLYTPCGGLQSGRFFDPFTPRAPISAPLPELLRSLEAMVDDAVRLALRSDVPVGLFLSGGVDSSLVATSAARMGRLSHAYCLTFDEPGFSEWEGAVATARHLGIPLTRVPLGPEAIEEFLLLVEHADDPLADSSALAVWTVSRAAARTNKVVLSGDGGDELFAGYLTYKATAWHGRVTSRLPMPLRRLLARATSVPTGEGKVSHTYKLMRFLRAMPLSPAVAHLTWNGTWLPEQAAGLIAPAQAHHALGALDALLRAYALPASPSLRELQALDLSEYLPNDILTKVDRMSMAHGLEVRAPLLSPELAEFALALPETLKSGMTGGGKRLLRSLASSRYSLQAGRRRKQGFSLPIHQWLRGPARERLLDLLSSEAIRSVGYLDAPSVERAVGDHLSGRRSYGWELWGLMVLSAWHRRRIARAVELPDAAVCRLDLPQIA